MGRRNCSTGAAELTGLSRNKACLLALTLKAAKEFPRRSLSRGFEEIGASAYLNLAASSPASYEATFSLRLRVPFDEDATDAIRVFPTP
jgi:hypothetical protein